MKLSDLISDQVEIITPIEFTYLRGMTQRLIGIIDLFTIWTTVPMTSDHRDDMMFVLFVNLWPNQRRTYTFGSWLSRIEIFVFVQSIVCRNCLGYFLLLLFIIKKRNRVAWCKWFGSYLKWFKRFNKLSILFNDILFNDKRS